MCKVKNIVTEILCVLGSLGSSELGRDSFLEGYLFLQLLWGIHYQNWMLSSHPLLWWLTNFICLCLDVWLSCLSMIYNCGCNRILACACFFLWMKSSVQFSCSVVSNSLCPHGLQRARLHCPGACSNSCPVSQWCHPTISSSVIPFSSCLQSFPGSGSFLRSQFFSSGSQRIGVSASTSVLPMNIQDWFPLGWTGWFSLQSEGLSKVFSNTIVQKHQFFGAQLSLWSDSHIHTWLLEKPQLWLDGPFIMEWKILPAIWVNKGCYSHWAITLQPILWWALRDLRMETKNAHHLSVSCYSHP